MKKPLLLLCLLAVSFTHLAAQTTFTLTFAKEMNGSRINFPEFGR